MALMFVNWAVTQRFLHSACFGLPVPADDWWSMFLWHLQGIVGSKAVTCDSLDEVSTAVTAIGQLSLVVSLMYFVTLDAPIVVRIVFVGLASLFAVPCIMRLVQLPVHYVELANMLACVIVQKMQVGICYSSTYCLWTYRRHYNFERMRQMWDTLRPLIFLSWLIALATQFVDSSLRIANDLEVTHMEEEATYFGVMLSNLRFRSWTLMMYVGLGTAIGYFAEATSRVVSLVVASSVSATRDKTPNNGLKEVVLMAYVYGCGVYCDFPVEMKVQFVLDVTFGSVVRWSSRSFRPCLLSSERSTHIRANVAGVVAIVARLSYVAARCDAAFGGQRSFIMAGNIYSAVRGSVTMASHLIFVIVAQRCTTGDTLRIRPLMKAKYYFKV